MKPCQWPSNLSNLSIYRYKYIFCGKEIIDKDVLMTYTSLPCEIKRLESMEDHDLHYKTMYS